MCDFPGKLIAWLDHELPDGEAADVRRHIEGCVECRSRVAAYQQVSKSVSAYCDEAVATQAPRGWIRWELALSTAAVVGIALLLSFPRTRVRVEQSMTREPATRERLTSTPANHDGAAASSSAVAVETALAPKNAPEKKIHHRHAATAAPARSLNPSVAPTEPAIQIAIPAEAMFPPGAAPDGINFVAELSIAPDGTAQGLRLQPRLVGRRSTQP
jgi:anti-sigma factor RsiW